MFQHSNIWHPVVHYYPNFHILTLLHPRILLEITNLLSEGSHDRYAKDTTMIFREVSNRSTGSDIPAKFLELKHTIIIFRAFTSKINETETEIKSIMIEINFSILTILRISYNMGTIIISGIGDLNRFDSTDKILAYAKMYPPSTHLPIRAAKQLLYPSGKHSSLYLRYPFTMQLSI